MKISGILVFCILLAALFSFSCRPVDEGDFFSHLAGGRHIIEHRSIPGQEPFVFTLENRPWHNPYWLSESGLYCLYALTGIQGIWAFSAIAFALLFGWAFWKNRNSGALLPFFVFFVFAIYPFYRPGIDLVPAFFALAFVAFLEKWSRQRDKKMVFALLILQILWVNAHPSFFMGLLTFLLSWPFNQTKEKDVRSSFLLFFLLLVGVLFSPHSLDTFFYPYPWLTCPEKTGSHWPLYWLGWIVLGAYFLRKNIPRAQLTIFLAWGVVSFFNPSWALPTLLYATRICASGEARVELDRKSRMLFQISIPGLLWICLAGPFQLDATWKPPWKQTCKNPSLAAIEALREAPGEARIFNDAESGAYLAWGTSQKILLDKRSFLYPPSLLREIRGIRWAPGSFENLARRMDIQIVVLDHTLPHTEGFLQWMSLRPQWHLVSCNERLAIFVKSARNMASFIEKHKLDDEGTDRPEGIQSPSHAEEVYRRTQAYLSLRLPKRALCDLQALSRFFEGTPANFFFEGRRALLEGDLQKAADSFRHSIAQGSRSKEARELLVQTCLRMGTPEALNEAYEICRSQSEETLPMLLYHAQVAHLKKDSFTARGCLQKILHRYPDHEEARQYLKNLEEQISGETMEQYLERSKEFSRAKNYKEAILVLKRALETDDRFAEVHLELGKLYLQIKNYQEAANHFKSVLRIVPGHLSASCKLAIAVAAMGQWEAALQILYPLNQRYPDHYEVRGAVWMVDQMAISQIKALLSASQDYKTALELCAIFIRKEEFKEAIELMEPFERKIGPEQKEDYRKIMGNLYLQEAKRLLNQKDVKAGMSCLNKSVQISPASFEAHLLSGVIALKKKEWEKAEEHFGRLVEIAPEDERGHQGLAFIELGKGLDLQFAGQYKEALEKFGAYLEKAPSGPERKNMVERIENLKKAQKSLEESRKIRTSREDFERGMACLEAKKWKEAVEHFEKVLSISPEFVEARFNLAQTFLRMENMEQAKTHFKKVLEARPDFPEAHLNLGHLYYRLYDYDRALPHFETYLSLTPNGKFSAQVREIVERAKKRSE